VYDVPAANPVTVTVPEPDVDKDPVILLGELTAVYEVIGAPPFTDGAE
jgi:hypothetical protein